MSAIHVPLLICAFAIAAAMLLAMVRTVLGPTVYDRILSLNMFGTKTVLLICVLTAILERMDYLDLGLAYALLNFIGLLAVLVFVQRHRQRLGIAQTPGDGPARPDGGEH